MARLWSELGVGLHANRAANVVVEYLGHSYTYILPMSHSLIHQTRLQEAMYGSWQDMRSHLGLEDELDRKPRGAGGMCHKEKLLVAVDQVVGSVSYCSDTTFSAKACCSRQILNLKEARK